MSDILESWRAGHGLPDVLVIDGHAHLGEWPHGANFETAEQAASEALAIMDANGIHAACILSGGCWANGADYRLGNDWLLDCTSRAPQRLIPFAHINGRDSREGMLAELQRMVRCRRARTQAVQCAPGPRRRHAQYAGSLRVCPGT